MTLKRALDIVHKYDGTRLEKKVLIFRISGGGYGVRIYDGKLGRILEKIYPGDEFIVA